MATLKRQLNLTNSAMMAMLRGMSDDELFALAGSEVRDLSGLSDAELDEIVDGCASAATVAKVRRPGESPEGK